MTYSPLRCFYLLMACKGKVCLCSMASLKQQSCLNTLLIKSQQELFCSNRLQMWMQKQSVCLTPVRGCADSTVLNLPIVTSWSHCSLFLDGIWQNKQHFQTLQQIPSSVHFEMSPEGRVGEGVGVSTAVCFWCCRAGACCICANIWATWQYLKRLFSYQTKLVDGGFLCQLSRPGLELESSFV